ncbi:hypothetical protein [Shinella sp. G-2]|uniref:hypothetical protein n=1 Tax=Shinella sp. G-2 TaxID=3133141 RepID=UPI003CFCDBA7
MMKTKAALVIDKEEVRRWRMKMSHENPRPITRPEVKRVIDPSDAVTGLGFVLGVVGAILGVIASVIVAPSFDAAIVFYCLIGALAGGSAGVVTGGAIGAALSVARGKRR